MAGHSCSWRLKSRAACADGRAMAATAEQILALAGWTVTLADLSDEAVARSRTRARELKAGVRIVEPSSKEYAPVPITAAIVGTPTTLPRPSALKPAGNISASDAERSFCITTIGP
jgi:hypothetical protein